jgi:hypothetical protein
MSELGGLTNYLQMEVAQLAAVFLSRKSTTMTLAIMHKLTYYYLSGINNCCEGFTWGVCGRLPDLSYLPISSHLETNADGVTLI